MHLFKANILFYISFNLIGYVLMFISVMGTPGMLNEEKPGTKPLIKLMDILLPAAWKGIPVLLFASVLAFYFQFLLVGKLCAITSLSLGLGVLLTMIGIYWTQGRKG
ncbi:hypothetical protein A4D02_22290 [Niastella koreensis]|uniref:Uncharacterized protein n=2 Tax=Niastella koreensis TaxID=354356 RepID=G8TFI8_NIAKG|nr:hypothetical protein [Niastella koreensis]AEV98419.1 hypothetical protein Niako_2064 [Niastella koreensis GR20-10]OQP53130.1 hypothetical protein A4D02_22290 [Niastella koreensis]